MGHFSRRLRLNTIHAPKTGNFRDLLDDFAPECRKEQEREAWARRFFRVRYPALDNEEIAALVEANLLRMHDQRPEPDHVEIRLHALGLIDPVTGYLKFEIPPEAEALLDNATYQRELAAARVARRKRTKERAPRSGRGVTA